MARSAQSEPGGIRSFVAVALVRAVIPAWLAIGAVLKLVDGSPSHLPAVLIKLCGAIGLDLGFVLELSIAVELIVAGVMILLPAVARTAGIAMLGFFLPVLVGDLVLGASSCGCFGAVEVPPWVTLVTDVFFLFGLIVLARGVTALEWTPQLRTNRVLVAGVWSLASVAAAFAPSVSGGRIDPGAGTVEVVEVGTSRPSQGYYLPDYATWTGRRFRDLDLASWIDPLPQDLDTGNQYILFYRKDCEHCHELMEIYFANGDQLPTTAVAVPERTGFPTVGVQPFVCAGCRKAELPAGVDWFLQTPVLVRLANGVVECAAEVSAEHPTCLDRF